MITYISGEARSPVSVWQELTELCQEVFLVLEELSHLRVHLRLRQGLVACGDTGSAEWVVGDILEQLRC